jgi:hypothetical protein
MKRAKHTTGLIIAALMMTLSLSALADRPFAQPGPDSAMIAGTPGQPANDIFPVGFVEIDGQNIPRRETFWLKPGKYELRVQPVIRDIGGLRSISGRVREDPDRNLIEVVVEPGKAYYIGARVDRQNRRQPYTTVLYRVEEQE